MDKKYTADKLQNMSRSELAGIILLQQEQLMTLNDNIEKLIEQIRIKITNLKSQRKRSSMKRKPCLIRLWRNLLLKRWSSLINGRNRKANVTPILRDFRRRRFPLTVFPSKNWMTSSEKETGVR